MLVSFTQAILVNLCRRVVVGQSDSVLNSFDDDKWRASGISGTSGNPCVNLK